MSNTRWRELICRLEPHRQTGATGAAVQELGHSPTVAFRYHDVVGRCVFRVGGDRFFRVLNFLIEPGAVGVHSYRGKKYYAPVSHMAAAERILDPCK